MAFDGGDEKLSRRSWQTFRPVISTPAKKAELIRALVSPEQTSCFLTGQKKTKEAVIRIISPEMKMPLI